MSDRPKKIGFGRQIRSGQFRLGGTVGSSDPAVVEAMAGSALDFLMIDTEHSPLGPETVQTLVMAASAAATPAIVRVGGLEPIQLMQPLDLGAAGVVVPRVRTADEVRSVVSSTRYPPAGLRGFGPRRASGYGRKNQEYVAESDDTVAVIVQIETREAVANLEEIASVPGLDGLLIGPNDLSAALGVPGQTDSEPVRDVVSQVVAVCRGADIGSGIASSAVASEVLRWKGFGLTFVIAGSGLFFLVDALDAYLAEISAALDGSNQ